MIEEDKSVWVLDATVDSRGPWGCEACNRIKDRPRKYDITWIDIGDYYRNGSILCLDCYEEFIAKKA